MWHHIRQKKLNKTKKDIVYPLVYMFMKLGLTLLVATASVAEPNERFLDEWLIFQTVSEQEYLE